jgi:hypothetical protein
MVLKFRYTSLSNEHIELIYLLEHSFQFPLSFLQQTVYYDAICRYTCIGILLTKIEFLGYKSLA